MPKSITVTIPKKGISKGLRSLSVQAEGYKGTTCKDATQFLEQLGHVISDDATPEMFEDPEVERIHESNG